MGGDLLIALAGDVMTGRGIDQILPAPGSPTLREKHVRDARAYVVLAERAHGPVPWPVDPTWPWGDALEAMHTAAPAVRVMNLETSVTTSDQHAPTKGIHYRMSPGNLACLAAANVDVWTLANNHVLDYGVPGLVETLYSTRSAGLTTAGAGADLEQARTTAVVHGGGMRVAVTSVAHGSSGVPPAWRAGPAAPGVALLPDLAADTARTVADDTARAAGSRGLRMVSVHWGGNWGYRVPDELRGFAHSLVDAGVDLVHGHSSHHPRPVEVYRGRLVLYGCGDLVNDYEGIGGHDGFRDDLRLLFLALLDKESRQLRGLTMLPFRSRRLRLERAGTGDVAWLAGTLGEASRAFGTSVRPGPDGSLRLALA